MSYPGFRNWMFLDLFKPVLLGVSMVVQWVFLGFFHGFSCFVCNVFFWHPRSREPLIALNDPAASGCRLVRLGRKLEGLLFFVQKE